MKKTTKLKAIVLSLMMVAMMLPMTMFAQKNDNFVTDYNYGTRTTDPITIWTANNGFQNDDFGAPLGSGLLILTAAGAGYAISRRKRNLKKRTTLLLAAMLLLGMTACRKTIVEPIAQPTSGNKVAITLNVGGGAKAEVDPPHVNFETGDQILVASKGHYVGTLTGTRVDDNVTFSGDITDPVVGEPLYFYFLGNKATGTLTPGASGSTSCTVNISDQTGYPHLPVISMGVSIDRSHGNAVVNYTSENHEYEAQLHNKASLMEFDVTSSSTAAICITGMNNKVTVDFGKLNEHGTGLAGSDTNEGFSYSKDTEVGFMKLSGKDSNGKTYAIVLPQAELTTTGEAYTIDGYEGTRPALPALGTNEYYTFYTINVSTQSAWDGDLSKLTDSSTEAFATARNGMRIYNTLTANAKVSIADGATVTLDGMSISYAAKKGNWAGLTCLGDATIVLADGTTNTVVSGFDSEGYNNWSGIYVPQNKTLTINGNTGTLNARCGQDSYGGSAAGIGCGFKSGSDCGNIIINGGVINARGGAKSAGIGGVNKRSCGSITINGGIVTAIGDSYGSDTGYGAGIGTGGSIAGTATVTCGDITITGGTVTATGGRGAAGIGTGHSGQNVAITCGNITISGGTVIATGGGDADLGYEGAAAIGTGNKEDTGTVDNKCGNITITTGVTRVTATKGSSNADNSIGTSGSNNTCGTITIGGVVTGSISTSPYTYEP